MDYYSRYPEVEILKSITSQTIINKLIKIFSYQGYPREIISDNGKQLVSEEMENFLSEYGIKHRRVIPYWARANGLVENINKTLKKAIQAACLHLKKIIILLWYGGRIVHSRLIKGLFRTDLTSL